VHVRLIAQGLRGLEQRAQPVGHAVRAQVRDHELPSQPMPRPHHGRVFGRHLEERGVDPVRHVRDARIRDAGLVQVRTEPLGDDHDARRAPIQVPLEREQRPQ